MDNELTAYEVECNCGAVLEVTEGEVVECPDCGEYIDDRGQTIF